MTPGNSNKRSAKKHRKKYSKKHGKSKTKISAQDDKTQEIDKESEPLIEVSKKQEKPLDAQSEPAIEPLHSSTANEIPLPGLETKTVHDGGSDCSDRPSKKAASNDAQVSETALEPACSFINSDTSLTASASTLPVDASFVKFNRVYKRYKMGDVTITASDDVNFSIEKGEFALIVGASGAGKTTVLNMLGGIDSADEGQIVVDGIDIASFNSAGLTKYRRYDIGFVFQFYNLMPNLTVKENVELASQIVKNAWDAREVLELVGLSHRLSNFPAQLSGGEQQRVSIARALAKRPKLLLCDEPTGALDYNTGRVILSLLHDTCKEQNMTVIVITHNTALTPIADRVITMKNSTVESTLVNENPVSIKDIEW